MSSHAARGSTAVQAKDYLAAIQHYTKALEESQSPIWLIERSTAYQRTKQYELSLIDAENAYHAAVARAKRELKATAQLRRGIALQSLGRIADARLCFVWVRELNEKEKGLGMWQARIVQEYDALTEGDERRKTTITQVPEKHENVRKADTFPPSKMAATPAASTASSTPAPVPIRTPQSINYDWYQNNSTVTLTVPYKGLQKEQVSFDLKRHHLDLSFPTSSGSDYQLDIDLFAAVDPAKSSYNVTRFKVEISLQKVQQGVKWANILGDPVEEIETVEAEAKPTIPDHILAGKQLPTYPSSAKNKVNWDKFEVEDDDEQTADDFFNKLYKDADPDTKRAMKKSMEESGGTTLSTDWKDVGSRRITPHPPGHADKD